MLYAKIDQQYIKPRNTIHIKEGDTLKIQCLSHADPVWYFDNNQKRFSQGDKVVIKGIKTNQQGYYNCKGVDGYTKKLFWARVLVLVKCKLY